MLTRIARERVLERVPTSPHARPSFFLAEVSQVAFLSDLLQHFVRGESWQMLPGVKYPDAVLLRERPRPIPSDQKSTAP